MKRRTGLLSTSDWILCWVGEEEKSSSSSDIWSGVVILMDDVRCCCVVSDDAAGANAVLHDADESRAVAKRIGRIMVKYLNIVESERVDHEKSTISIESTAVHHDG